MKIILSFLAVSLFAVMPAIAQVKTDVKEETTTKRVTKRDTEVRTKIVQEIDQEKDLLEVEGNDELNQNSSIKVVKDNKVEVVKDAVSKDERNVALIEKNKAKKQMDLEESIRAEKERAEMKAKKAMQEKMAAQQKELAERRAMLEKRPDGIVKLKKDN
ncbi:hypothetical protein [Cochleicola gelatinilyticus]|uniref:Uncharacterized protein n=1 Tax=Cochleicola gelatinilyticus TaxID=1763537 RepID=A0A167H1G4_9FLAO|nr:hypothetical protein [Cochleicola gelatinilyticus]OAB78113.1 hypothetical protein ULVI_11565 [Cochleicola gelatinilyticus]